MATEEDTLISSVDTVDYDAMFGKEKAGNCLGKFAEATKFCMIANVSTICIFYVMSHKSHEIDWHYIPFSQTILLSFPSQAIQ